MSHVHLTLNYVIMWEERRYKMQATTAKLEISCWLQRPIKQFKAL